jgi:hypothetical protein
MAGKAARKGRGAPKRLPPARCADPLHRGAHIVGNGTRTSGGRRVRQLRCTPLVGDPHTFYVTIADSRPVSYSVPPTCDQGHGVPVTRNGLYGTGARRRQRYFCPVGGTSGKGHSFTPPLPREHVHPASGPCPHCDERRGVHRGETAAARRHSWPTKTVARGLDMLSAGESYAKVSLWALDPKERAARRRRAMAATSTSAKRVSLGTRESRNAWRIAANWVEAFAPVIWGPLDALLRAEAQAERARLDAAIAAGLPLERPQVVIIDDVPVLGRSGRTKRRDGGFFLLVAGEVGWEERLGTWEPRLRLRLVRAMAKSNTAAWRLVFDELGYVPDFIVADAGTGIGAAVRAHFEPPRTRFVPSLWHVRRSVLRAFGLEASRAPAPAIAAHCDLLARDSPALASEAAWDEWWNELGRLVAAHHLSATKFRNQRRNYQDPIAAVLPHLAANPGLRFSTGGLETLVREHVSRALTLRTQFANIERTNSLFDLVVARTHGAFRDLGEVAQLLRADAEGYAGWTVALRTIDDPQPEAGRYSSLRDATLLDTLAESRGL